MYERFTTVLANFRLSTTARGFRFFIKPIAILLIAGALMDPAISTADDLSKPLRTSADGHFLLQPDGAPFFWLGDTAMSLFTDLTLEESGQYLENRARKGFNIVVAIATSPGFVGEIDGPDRYGQRPFVNNNLSVPNDRYWLHVDRVIKSARDNGLRIALMPTWGQGTVDVAKRGAATPFDVQTARQYGTWIAKRYQGYGITWLMGGDTLPLWVADVRDPNRYLKDSTAVYDAMAQGIVDVLGKSALISFYPACCSLPGTAQPRTSLYFGHKSWLGMNFIQSSHFDDPREFLSLTGFQFAWRGAYNYEPVRDEYDSYPTRPIVDGEQAAEDIPIDVFPFADTRDVRSSPRYTDYDIRLRAYHAVFSGAVGVGYTNNNYSWYFYDPLRANPGRFGPRFGVRQSWIDALESPGAGQMRHVKDLMLSRPYLTRIPDQSLVTNATSEGATHISATRSRDGSYLMIYLPVGQIVTIDMNKLSGSRAVAWWYDPRSGTASPIEGIFQTNRTTTFEPPSKGPGHDWILVIDNAAEHFPPPGEGPNA